MNIQEVRQKFPQYSDLSDQQLADALHSKFYADMPKEQFYSKVGLSEQSEQKEERGGLSEFGVAALRGARNTAEAVKTGVMSMPQFSILKPAVEMASNYIKENVHPDLSPTRTDPAGKFINTTGELAGASVAGGLPTGVKQAVTQVVLPSVGGGIGEAVGGEPGKIVGSIVAPAATTAAVSGLKNAIAPRVSKNLETFKQAGTTPSVGQATDSVFFRGLENLAAKFPGGAGVIKKFIEKQQAEFGARARTRVSAEDAGRAIERGITGQGGFLERTRQTWRQLDDELGAKVGSDYRFAPNNTLKVLDDLVQPTPGAEQTTKALVNPKIAEIRENFRTDAINNLGGMPFEAVRDLRSRVGSMLDDALVSGIPMRELKELYGALSKDLEAGANAIGAGKEFARQNNFYRARMERIEGVLERVIGKSSQPEDIFKRFMPTDPDQASKVRAVMRSLDPGQRKVVTDAVVNRLGRATPGRQDEVGSVFSSETFLSNWNKLSPGAKEQLFPNHAMRANVEQIARAASKIRSGSGVYANPSGTAGSFAAYSVYGSPIAAAASASAVPLVAASGAVGAAYIGSKMLTNQKVVEWLAKPVNPAKAGDAASHLARLAVIYNQSNDPGLRAELEHFMDSAAK